MSGETADWDLTIEVFVPTDGGEGNVATGYPVAKDRIITAAHVFKSQQSAIVRWHHSDKRARRFRPIQRIIWDGRDHGFDVAVLECTFPNAVEGFAEISSTPPKENEEWAGRGFPAAGKKNGRRSPVGIIGKVHPFAASDQHLELGADYTTKIPGGWRGASGSPVFVAGKLVGIVRSCPKEFDQNRLYAVPICQLLANDGFRQAIRYGTEKNRESLRMLEREAINVLSGCEKAARIFAEELNVAPDPQKTFPNRIVGRLMDLDALRLLGVCLTSMKKSGGKKSEVIDSIDALCLLVLPAVFRRDEIEQFEEFIFREVRGPLVVRAHSRTVVEALMSRVDGRRMDVVATDRGFEIGEALLQEPPEAGPAGTAIQSVDLFDALIGKKYLASVSSKELSPKQREAVVQMIRDRHEFKGFRHYYVYEISGQAFDKPHHDLIDKLRQRYEGSIVFVGMEVCPNEGEEAVVMDRFRMLLKREVKWLT